MPGYDRTGPGGAGPMTGRLLGRCTGNTADLPVRGFRFGGRGFRGGFRRGLGRGLGFHRGYRFSGYSDDYIPASDETLLENEARTLKDQLSWIEKELGKIRKGSKED